MPVTIRLTEEQAEDLIDLINDHLDGRTDSRSVSLDQIHDALTHEATCTCGCPAPKMQVVCNCFTKENN